MVIDHRSRQGQRVIAWVDEVNVGPALHDEHLKKVEPKTNKTDIFCWLWRRALTGVFRLRLKMCGEKMILYIGYCTWLCLSKGYINKNLLSTAWNEGSLLTCQQSRRQSGVACPFRWCPWPPGIGPWSRTGLNRSWQHPGKGAEAFGLLCSCYHTL